MAEPVKASIYGGSGWLPAAAALVLAIGAQRATAEAIDPPERYVTMGLALERQALQQQQHRNPDAACGLLYRAQVAFAQAVDRGLDAAEAEIDRIETARQALQCPAR
jgi:hypothetical protein